MEAASDLGSEPGSAACQLRGLGQLTSLPGSLFKGTDVSTLQAVIRAREKVCRHGGMATGCLMTRLLMVDKSWAAAGPAAERVATVRPWCFRVGQGAPRVGTAVHNSWHLQFAHLEGTPGLAQSRSRLFYGLAGPSLQGEGVVA